MAHATWHLSSLRSQEQKLVLSAALLQACLTHKSSSCTTDCPTTLFQEFYNQGGTNFFLHNTALQLCFKICITEMSFWLGIALAKLRAPTGALQQHTRVPCKLSENLELTNDSSSASPYQQWWCTSRYLRPITKSTFYNVSSIRTPTFFLHKQATLRFFWFKAFIEEMTWPGITLTRSAHPQEQIKSTQECSTSSQKKSRAHRRPSLSRLFLRFYLWWCTSHDLRLITKPLSFVVFFHDPNGIITKEDLFYRGAREG